MSAAPFLLTGEPLRRLLQRITERHQASELRAWKRRHGGAHRYHRTMSLVIGLAVAAWVIVAILVVCTTFDL